MQDFSYNNIISTTLPCNKNAEKSVIIAYIKDSLGSYTVQS